MLVRGAVAFVLVAVAASVVATIASSTSVVPRFLLESPTAQPPEAATIRLGGTPLDFKLQDREKPFRKAIRLYLVRAGVANKVTSRFDRRLHFVGRLVPDNRMRAVLSFTVPPLATGTYGIAYWCPGCAVRVADRVFGMQPELRIEMPSATETCPVSGEGKYGNGLLSTTLPPDGVLPARIDDDGLFQKIGWLPHTAFPDSLVVRGERLDAPSPPMTVLGVYWGYASSGPAAKGSWASAVKFPSEGCWRITGRVQDVTLSYVVRVVPGW